jgi:hypothetical protein
VALDGPNGKAFIAVKEDLDAILIQTFLADRSEGARSGVAVAIACEGNLLNGMRTSAEV